MGKLYVKMEPPADLNRNTEWFTYPGVWTTYILILFFSWLIVLSLTNCTPGMAWTIVNLSHFLLVWLRPIQVTYHFFHWKKGTPFGDDQGIYNSLTWWEQMDGGKQLTRNRKFLTVVPVVLYLIASHTTDYEHPMLFLNTLAVLILVVAKFPNMHKTWLGRPQPKSASPLVFLSAHGRLSLVTRSEAYPPLTSPHHRQCSDSPPFESLHKTTSDHPLVTVRPQFGRLKSVRAAFTYWSSLL
ncbi:ORMDL family protein, partial [Striga asiatica]